MAPLRKHVLAALCMLSASSALLALRYSKSAAFERPVHFSILTLFLTGTALCLCSRYKYSRRSSGPPRYKHLACNGADNKDTLKSLDAFLFLLLVLARTALFWRTVRTVHCSWDGLEAFLPFTLVAFDLVGRRPVPLPRSKHDLVHYGAPGNALLFALVALAWGISNTEIYIRTERSSGAICPPGIWERMIPLAQLATVLLDAEVLRSVSQMRHAHDGGSSSSSSWRRIGPMCLASAGVVSFVAAWTCIDRTTAAWSVYLSAVSVADLVLDSIVAACELISGVYLLGVFPPFTVALIVAATNVLVHLELQSLDGTLARVWSTAGIAHVGLVVFIGGGALLLRHAETMSGGSAGRLISSRALGGLWLLLVAAMFAQARLLGATYNPRPSDTIARLVALARNDSDRWIAAARKSTSLHEAVHEYRRRYGIPPPPHFDKWYEYAESVEAPVIDDYGQIHRDLLPFWGTPPAVLREQTAHLLEHPRYSFGGLVVRDGRVSVSPHIRGTHRWMMDTMKTMIEPFARWLPDMQLAFNLDDECRISVPHRRMRDYRAEAHRSRSRLAARRQELRAGFSAAQDPPWATAYLDEARGEELFRAESPWFAECSKRPIFDDWIASACDPAAPVRRWHWWNRKAPCAGCAAAHMTDGIVSNWMLAGDLCHQPDMAYLHGFLTSPSALAASHVLFPVFSQSRVGGFADILYPSPWNFGDMVANDDADTSVPWSDKINGMYWRGASSDGFAAHGAWQSFLRARFVNMAAHLDGGRLPADDDDASPIRVNVSFVGTFGRCDRRDCAAEHAHFYGGPGADPPPPLDFQEHWRYQHLVDLDGAGFSGRFVPFLRSASLPYRAALFRTWWEERVHPWRHFVPVDVRLSDLWGLLGFFGGRRGEAEASEIARQGADWARRALRKDDMQVYMFRLLLEWGRLVDDRREEIGYSTHLIGSIGRGLEDGQELEGHPELDDTRELEGVP